MTWALAILAILAIVAALFLADRLLWPRQSEPKEPPDVVGAQVIKRGAAGGAYGLPWSTDDEPKETTFVFPPGHNHGGIPNTVTLADTIGQDKYSEWLKSLE